MAVSKHKKQDRNATWLYSSLTAIYLAVFAMFTQVASPPPVTTTQYTSSVTTARPAPKPQPRPAIQGIPVHITVPSLGINLNVQVGHYDAATGGWSLDLANAYYAAYSLPVNESNGTTLIYSHAQAGLFEKLPLITEGSEAIITTDTGHTFRYQYQSMRQVDPSDTSVFVFDGPPTLVLQTCTGDWSQYRALFSFKLLSISKA
jgi:LPXTG-site transpeptidase (sortase) family protein